MIDQATEPLFCSKCGREIDRETAEWLDMNILTHELRADPWPEDVSQGGFPFGPGCARSAKVWGEPRSQWVNR